MNSAATDIFVHNFWWTYVHISIGCISILEMQHFWFGVHQFFFLLFIWLHWVLVVAHRIFVHHEGLFCCMAWASLLHSMWDLSFATREWTCVPCITRWILNHWTSRGVPISFLVDITNFSKRLYQLIVLFFFCDFLKWWLNSEERLL